MTNLEKYHKVLKQNLKAKDEELNDATLVYNAYPEWTSVVHMELVTDIEDAFDIHFSTLDLMSFTTYSKGLEIIRKLGVDI